MSAGPNTPRTIAFFDGQNLFHAAREAFGCRYPDYDPVKLARRTCRTKDWQLKQVRFYTGYPDKRDNPFWNHFWSAKLAQMGRQGVVTFARKLRYRNQRVVLPNGRTHCLLVGQEKGIDVRIALDIIRLAHNGQLDVALVFSQDQDLSEVADEVRRIARSKRRWLKMASAFPSSPLYRNTRGIDKTDWVRIAKDIYDECVDARDYRPKNA